MHHIASHLPSPVKLLISIALSFCAAAIGSLATQSAITGWYATINKPSFNPPNEVFGPVWSVLYTCMGISLFLVWQARNTRTKTNAYIAFGIQLALNTAWSLVFFGLEAPWAAFGIITLLLVAIVATIYQFASFSKTAAYLLAPYLAWVSFASILNLAIALRN